MISAEFKRQSNIAAAEFLIRKGAAIGGATRRVMKMIAIDLQSYVKKFKLSGQVLKNRTGNLRRAITQTMIATTDRASAIVGVSPNASKYAKIHEFGGQIDIPAVDGKLMVFELNGQSIFTMKHKAFSVHMPERSYLRSSLRENKQRYYELLNQMIAVEVVK